MFLTMARLMVFHPSPLKAVLSAIFPLPSQRSRQLPISMLLIESGSDLSSPSMINAGDLAGVTCFTAATTFPPICLMSYTELTVSGNDSFSDLPSRTM